MKRLPSGDVIQGHEVALTQKLRGLGKASFCDQKRWTEFKPFRNQPWAQDGPDNMARIHVTASKPAAISPVSLIPMEHQAAVRSSAWL